MGNESVFIRFLIGSTIHQTDAITVFVMRIARNGDRKKLPQKSHARLQWRVIPAWRDSFFF